MDSRDASELFDAYCFAHGFGPRPYRRDQEWLRFFDGIAERIVGEIQPRTVLDAGCAMGFLVEGLRSRGVEAFGIDISDYAIQNVHPGIQPYCRVGSVAEAFPRQYDLIVCIEVLEHLTSREAERAVANLCQHADDVLFSSTPFDYKEATHFNVQPPEYWAELFARHGFFHDVDFDASFVTPWTVRFRKAIGPVARMIAAYERRLWQLRQENQARRELNIEQRNELAAKEWAVQALADKERALAEKEREAQALKAQIQDWEARWAHIEASLGGMLLRRLQNLRARLAPPGSSRDVLLEALRRSVARGRDASLGQVIRVDAISPRAPVQTHQSTVEIVVCAHNALADVQRCLESVVRHTTQPYALILVDDGSDPPTRDYLAEFAKAHAAVLLRNERPGGYTRAANQGLRRAAADYVVLLNSDTVATPEWLDRLIACAESDPRIGLVGPLSNTASWQSIPDIVLQGDWATNPLPDGMTIEAMGALVARFSARLYPALPFLNGFCLLIRRQVVKDIGYFDEENFGAGYGEENDYGLRARQAGWALALADDAYVYHAQGRSYSDERRRRLTQQANTTLLRKYGERIVHEGVAICRDGRVMEGIRAHSRVVFEQQAWIEKGRAAFAGRRVLFLLPVRSAGGGGSVVVMKARLMRQMGVRVDIFNLTANREEFERGFPTLDIPVIYGEVDDVPTVAARYDAVVATFNASVAWLSPTLSQSPHLVRGYFIQDFEPYFYPPHSEGFKSALASYALIPDMARFATTEWIRQEIIRHTGVDCDLVGPAFDANLFRPRPRAGPEWPDRPLRIAAMIRPESHYRAPQLTMEVLRRTAKKYGARVEIRLFGTDPDNPGFAGLPRDFAWQLAGRLGQPQMAQFLNEVDIFVDFSSHQALGITAQEAMACGVDVVVPARGGVDSYARQGENCLVVDTSSRSACEKALQRLIEDDALRARLQKNAIFDACAFYPEKPAFNILDALFNRRR